MTEGKIRNIPFSPPDNTEAEIEEVKEAMKSGWITTGIRTKEFERKIAEYIGVKKAVCLNSATAALEPVDYDYELGRYFDISNLSNKN